MTEQNYNNITEPGVYRARPRSWGLKENTDSGVVQFSMLFECNAKLVNGEWADAPQTPLPTVFGNYTVIKKDGTLHAPQIKSLRTALGWEGTLRDLEQGDWSGCEVRIVCNENEYNGMVSIRADWINPLEGGGGPTLGNVADDRLKALEARYGSQLRALAGSTGKLGSKDGQKAIVPARGENPASDGLNFEPIGAQTQDDIPF